ncbi:alpha/beta hydrolase [Chryseolinea lacunae]|uniref:Alpha/beta hydrolase n=1 Tax=Chryseolinea lacunae TaxID=2801331 RepID=A0ABS1KKP9_9BACT|nr:alpha/beta hydrolase [Chryseolinea lacunae]MBL0739813.1 alpha/beta hydrolase [Chryseolinea lacunae]
MNNLKEERKGFDSLGLSYAVEADVRVESAIFGGVTSYWFTPPNIASPEVVIYTHGGGYIYGSLKSHRAMVSHFAKALGRRILFVEYSLAPEKTFPTALNETVAVIQHLHRTFPEVQFSLMGDSAGGNLALSVALNLKQLDAPAPLYQILLSPWLNMDTVYPSYSQNEKLDPIISKDFLRYAASQYAGGKDIGHPLMSPIHGDFRGLSPTLTLVGAKEVLRDDSLVLHAASVKAGATSVLQVFENANHVWMLTDIESKDSKDALRAMQEFLTLQEIADIKVMP